MEPGSESQQESAPDWAAAMAIMAHGLLTPVAVMRGFAETLLRHWDAVDDTRRDVYLQRIIENADFVSETLRDIARGLPPGASQVLAELDAKSQRRYLDD